MKNDGEMPELLYFGHGTASHSPLHQHSFYQLEWCLEGNLPIRDEYQQSVLARHGIWLIPPDCPHGFPGSRAASEFISLKFKSAIVLPSIRKSDAVILYHMRAIFQIMNGEGGFSPYMTEGRRIIEAHLQGLLVHLRSELRGEKSEPPFLLALREYIYSAGYPANIKEFAQQRGVTRAQLRYQFTTASGGGTRIREFKENILIEQVARHLKYSAMNLGEIAREMNFPSLFAFSRFFKRKTGVPPSAFRLRK